MVRLRYWLFLIGISLSSRAGHAVVCSVSNVTPVNFGSTINVLATTTSMTSMTFHYSCAKELGDVLAGVTLCFNIGNSAVSGQIASRAMSSVGPPISVLNYQLYQDAGGAVIWGNQSQEGATPMVNLNLLNLTPVTGNLTVYARLNTPQPNAIPGVFQDSYTATTAFVTQNIGLLSPPATCGNTTTATFPFIVTATVVKKCNISYANHVNVGAVNANQLGATASSSLGGICSRNTPYTIGLLPSNSNTAGNGIMKGNRSGNTDTVPYQLRAMAGATGNVWGNTAQNSVAGTGTGVTFNHNVYVTLPSVNYTPDSYSDTVTISVTY